MLLIVEFMIYSKMHLRFNFKEQIKMHTKVLKRLNLTLHVVVHLEGISENVSKDELQDLCKDTLEGAFGVEFKGTLMQI